MLGDAAPSPSASREAVLVAAAPGDDKSDVATCRDGSVSSGRIIDKATGIGVARRQEEAARADADAPCIASLRGDRDWRLTRTRRRGSASSACAWMAGWLGGAYLGATRLIDAHRFRGISTCCSMYSEPASNCAVDCSVDHPPTRGPSIPRGRSRPGYGQRGHFRVSSRLAAGHATERRCLAASAYRHVSRPRISREWFHCCAERFHADRAERL